MSTKRILILCVALMTCGAAIAAGPSGLQIRTSRPDVVVTNERALADDKALVSVIDAKQDPVLGLTAKDFVVVQAGVAARIVSVQPIAQGVEVPRHVVLVLDNSYSMVKRKAVTPLLQGVDAVLKSIRPVDDVRMVVFSSQTVTMGGRDLHVKTLQSNQPAELADFAAKAYDKGVTDETFLHEAMLAGLELIRDMPAADPRFLVVFSDGEDLNSSFTREEVSKVAAGLEGFRVFAIDHMPTPEIDPFLASFASQNRGQARKAGTGADLLTLFQQVASRMDYYYVVHYSFATPPPPAKIMVFFEAALFDFGKSALTPAGKEKLKTYREQVQAEMSRADKVAIIGHTDNVGAPDANMALSLQRAKAVGDYLISLGVDRAKLDTRGEGMTEPIADNGTEEGRAKNRRVEIAVIGMGK